jgi:putative membrane protein
VRWWTFDPSSIIAPALAAYLYGRRVATLGRRGRPVPGWRQVCFYCGLAVVLLALVSPVDALGERRFFWVHMTQHLLLGDIAPLLVVAGLSGPVLRPMLAMVSPGRALRALMNPLVALALWSVDLWAWHIPAMYGLALDHPAVHVLEHVCFFSFGALMWAALLEPLPAPRWFGSGAKALYVVVARMVSGMLASLFIWAAHPLYGFYAARERTAGIAPLDDQAIAGGIMFVEGALVTIVAIAWLGARWLREVELRQGVIDRGGDAITAERAARYGRPAR